MVYNTVIEGCSLASGEENGSSWRRGDAGEGVPTGVLSEALNKRKKFRWVG